VLVIDSTTVVLANNGGFIKENIRNTAAGTDPCDHAHIVRRYIEAYNSHDIDRIMSYYVTDIRFEIVGVWVRVGSEQARERVEWDAETHIHLAITNVHSRGNIIQCRLSETSDWLGLSGVGEMHYEPCHFIFRDTLIKEIRAELTSESRQRYMRYWQEIVEWTTANRSKLLLELMPAGKFAYGRERARKWLGLLEEWRDATGG
jgi:hypothetical protein